MPVCDPETLCSLLSAGRICGAKEDRVGLQHIEPRIEESVAPETTSSHLSSRTVDSGSVTCGSLEHVRAPAMLCQTGTILKWVLCL